MKNCGPFFRFAYFRHIYISIILQDGPARAPSLLNAARGMIFGLLILAQRTPPSFP